MRFKKGIKGIFFGLFPNYSAMTPTLRVSFVFSIFPFFKDVLFGLFLMLCAIGAFIFSLFFEYSLFTFPLFFQKREVFQIPNDFYLGFVVCSKSVVILKTFSVRDIIKKMLKRGLKNVESDKEKTK